jgi:hypothetical protein
MPQIPDTITRQVAQNIREVSRKQPQFTMYDQDGTEFKRQLYEQVVKNQGLEVVGQGHESVVFSPEKRGLLPDWVKDAPDKLRDDVVIAIDKLSIRPKEAKILFYTQLLFSTLFPHNFPRFYAAFGSTKYDEPSGTIRQKLTKASIPPDTISYPFSQVETELPKMGILLQFDYGHWWNFLVTDQGEEYYVDKPQLIKPSLQEEYEGINRYPTVSSHINREQLAEYLATSPHYSDPTKVKILRIVERISELEQKK